MDSPAYFDIWCQIREGTMMAAAKWTARMQSFSVFTAYKIVGELVAGDGWIQIFVCRGWDDLPILLQQLPEFVQPDCSVITETSYRPAECVNFCVPHTLKYISPVCPICEGFYISKVVDGTSFVCENSHAAINR